MFLLGNPKKTIITKQIGHVPVDLRKVLRSEAKLVSKQRRKVSVIQADPGGKTRQTLPGRHSTHTGDTHSSSNFTVLNTHFCLTCWIGVDVLMVRRLV